MQFWALIVDSFRESRDRKVFWAMLLISLASVGAMACVGFEPGRVTFFFGVWDIETSFFTDGASLRSDMIATLAVDIIADTVLGTIGVILAIIATAGFFPGLMDRGGIDSVLAKPLSRWTLFLGKYLGAMAFMLFHAGLFVVLSFLVMGFRWGTWLPSYLWMIPLMVLLFSYLYCISVLVAVLSRSAMLAALVTLGAWMMFGGIQLMDDQFEDRPQWREYTTAYHAVHVARWIVPKTADIMTFSKEIVRAARADDFLAGSADQDQAMIDHAVRVEERRMAVSPYSTIGSSLLFEGVIVLLAMWRFNRKDF